MVDVCYPSGTDWSCAYTPEEIAALDPAVMERSEALAWSTLSALTGYRVSTCPVTIRPCAKSCRALSTWQVAPVYGGGSGLQPFISGGAWFNACGCTTDCSCTSLSEVIMPGEVGSVLSVWLDGVELAADDYRIDNGTRLVRTDGEAWPACQNMAAPTTDSGTFAVEYYPGVAPNDLLRYAAGVLAAEFYLACSGKECRLPNGVTNVTRAGMSMQVQSGLFTDNSTGITEVDAIIRIYNPSALKSRPRVMSPDRTRVRITTWSA
jgi:hypothetical protein